MRGTAKFLSGPLDPLPPPSITDSYPALPNKGTTSEVQGELRHGEGREGAGSRAGAAGAQRPPGGPPPRPPRA